MVSTRATSLRTLLARSGSYPAIAAAVASGELPRFRVYLFEHVGHVYERIERAAMDDVADIEALRLTALVHEEPRESLPDLLEAAGMSDLAPVVVAVIGAFGALWKLATEEALRDWVAASETHLASVLLFEVAHEGRPTAAMERAADLGGHGLELRRWAARLAG